jgi:hypothetical protein
LRERKKANSNEPLAEEIKKKKKKITTSTAQSRNKSDAEMII